MTKMVNSNRIEDLRKDVAANCRIFLELCKKETGFPLGISSTVRDDEWQRYAVSQGWAPPGATVPTFHSVKAGLAFDIFRNVKGSEWDNRDKFFDKCGAAALKMGFVWPISKSDLGHIQWGGPGRNWTSAMILRGEYPPEMPLYKLEDDEMVEKMNIKVVTDTGTKKETVEGIWKQETGGANAFYKLQDINKTLAPFALRYTWDNVEKVHVLSEI